MMIGYTEVGAATLCLLCVWAAAVGETGMKTSGQDSRNELEYPAHVAIPKDIPSTFRTKEVGGKSEGRLVFPVAIYSMRHYEGWQMCLKEWGLERVKVGRLVWKRPLQATNEPFTMWGREDGYNACRKKIIGLLEKHSESHLRRLARMAYSPLPDVSPPRREAGDDPSGKRNWVPRYPGT